MQAYIIRRLLLFIPTLLLVSTVIFVILRIIPGDPALLILSGGAEGTGTFTQEELDTLRTKMGLNKPLVLQYTDWLYGIIRLDWGMSLRYTVPVLDEVAHRIPVTLELAFLSMFAAVGIGIVIGLLSALHQDAWADYTIRVFSIMGLAIPTFWAGTMVILVLSVGFDWIPPPAYAKLWEDPFTHFQQMIWPVLVLGYYFSAYTARMTRAQMLEVLRQDYIRTARSKGLRERVVVVRHALKNAMLPILTLSGVQLGHILGGAVITETIFNLPGLGRLLVDAIFFRDYPTVQMLIVLLAFLFLTVSLVVDLLYAWLDPRIRYT